MAKRTVEVDDAEVEAANKRLEADLDREVQERLAKHKEQPTMDPAAKARLEQAEKDAKTAADQAADLKKRLEALESCKNDQDKAANKRLEDEGKETLRRAKLIAEATVPTERVESEAARLAAMGPAAVDEIARRTPAPSADPLLRAMRREAEPAKGQAQHYVRRQEALPDGSTTMALTVSDWTKYGADTPSGHPKPQKRGVPA